MFTLSRKRSPHKIVDVTKDASTALILEGQGWVVTPGTFTPDSSVAGTKPKAKRRR